MAKKRAKKTKTRKISADDPMSMPKELRDQLVFDTRRGGLRDRILLLFERADEEMSINDVILRLYEKYGEVHKRGSVSTTLSVMSRENRGIQRVDLGTYKRT